MEKYEIINGQLCKVTYAEVDEDVLRAEIKQKLSRYRDLENGCATIETQTASLNAQMAQLTVQKAAYNAEMRRIEAAYDTEIIKALLPDSEINFLKQPSVMA